jgi:hypothetical protein
MFILKNRSIRDLTFLIFISLFLSGIYYLILRPANLYITQVDIKLPMITTNASGYHPITNSEARYKFAARAEQEFFISSMREKFKSNEAALKKIDECSLNLRQCIDFVYSNEKNNFLSFIVEAHNKEVVEFIAKNFEIFILDQLNTNTIFLNRQFIKAESLHRLSIEEKNYVGFYYSFIFLFITFLPFYLIFRLLKKIDE